MEAEHVNETAVETAKKLGAEDAISILVLSDEVMARFANDSLTVTKRINDASLLVYLAKDGRRVVGSSSNPDDASVRAFVKGLYESLRTLPREVDFARIPAKASQFRPKPDDAKSSRLPPGAETQAPEFAHRAIDAAHKAGGSRTAGAVEISHSALSLLTSAGTSGAGHSQKMLMNVRAFAENEASGHGLSCSASLDGFDPEGAGARAGEHARRMRSSSPPEGGTYQVLMSPTVSANLISLMGDFASAFAVDAGISYLGGRLNQKVASPAFTLKDHGRIPGALDPRTFDDEGVPTQTTPIIDRGVLKNYLHNVTTAKKSKTASTGNAGWIDPNPWNLEVAPGDSTYEQMLAQIKLGVVLTSNWYTRFTNYRTGEFSTVPRDGAYLVKNGKVVRPLNSLRVSDTLERLFSSVVAISKEREWIQWWEVDVPTLAPWILVDGVKVTRAYG